MEKYVASSPQSEVIGRGLMPYMSTIVRPEIEPVLAQHSLNDIDPEKWYPQQLTLDILREIKAKAGKAEVDALSLVAIGMRIVDEAIFPPFEGLDQALQILTAAYLMNHRNLPEADRLLLEDLAPGQARVINATPYPDDLIYGYFYALIRRFAPSGTNPIIKYEAPQNVDSPQDMAFLVTW